MGNPFFRDRDTTIRFPETHIHYCFQMFRDASRFLLRTCVLLFFFFFASEKQLATRASVRSFMVSYANLSDDFRIRLFPREICIGEALIYIKRLTWANIFFLHCALFFVSVVQRFEFAAVFSRVFTSRAKDSEDILYIYFRIRLYDSMFENNKMNNPLGWRIQICCFFIILG